MARPRKQHAPDPTPVRAPTRPAPVPANDAPPAPASDPGNRLYPVEGPEMDATDFGRVTTKWQRWKLVREKKIASVRVGRNVFITERAIADFIARGGSR